MTSLRIEFLEACASTVNVVTQLKNIGSGMILWAWLFWLVINFDSISGKGIHMVTALRQRTPFQTHPPTHNVQLTFCVVTWVWTAPLIYLIPIKIRAPLIFAHLACAKIKGSKFAQYKSSKIKGRRKYATNEWQTDKCIVKQGYAKIKGARNLSMREK